MLLCLLRSLETGSEEEQKTISLASRGNRVA